MSIGATALTPDDLLAMPDGKSYELVDGELMELKRSQESSWISGVIHSALGKFGQRLGLGWAFPGGTGFVCFPDEPGRVRKPDASFVLRARQPGGPVREGYGTVCPDLVVEVVSPHDPMWEVESKVEDWLSAGVQVVWVVMPPTRSVQVYQRGVQGDFKIQRLTGDQELTLPELIPDLRLRVRECFLPPGE